MHRRRREGLSSLGGLGQDQLVERQVGDRLAQTLVLNLQLLHALDLVGQGGSSLIRHNQTKSIE